MMIRSIGLWFSNTNFLIFYSEKTMLSRSRLLICSLCSTQESTSSSTEFFVITSIHTNEKVTIWIIKFTRDKFLYRSLSMLQMYFLRFSSLWLPRRYVGSIVHCWRLCEMKNQLRKVYVIIVAWGNLYSHRNRKFYVLLVDVAIWESRLPTEKITRKMM